MNFSDLTFLSSLTPVETLWMFLAFYLFRWVYQNCKERKNYELAAKSFFDDFEHNTRHCILTEPHENSYRIAVMLFGVNWKRYMETFNTDGKDYWKRYYYLLKTADSREFRKFYLELCEVYGIKNRSTFRKWLKAQDDKITANRLKKAKKKIKNSNIWTKYKLKSEFDYDE